MFIGDPAQFAFQIEVDEYDTADWNLLKVHVKVSMNGRLLAGRFLRYVEPHDLEAILGPSLWMPQDLELEEFKSQSPRQIMDTIYRAVFQSDQPHSIAAEKYARFLLPARGVATAELIIAVHSTGPSFQFIAASRSAKGVPVEVVSVTVDHGFFGRAYEEIRLWTDHEVKHRGLHNPWRY